MCALLALRRPAQRPSPARSRPSGCPQTAQRPARQCIARQAGGAVVPAGAELYAQLVDSEWLWRCWVRSLRRPCEHVLPCAAPGHELAARPVLAAGLCMTWHPHAELRRPCLAAECPRLSRRRRCLLCCRAATCRHVTPFSMSMVRHTLPFSPCWVWHPVRPPSLLQLSRAAGPAGRRARPGRRAWPGACPAGLCRSSWPSRVPPGPALRRAAQPRAACAAAGPARAAAVVAAGAALRL